MRNLLAFFLSLELAVPTESVLQLMRGARLSKKELFRFGVENLAFFDPTSTRPLRPYDDRGADLLASTPEALKDIHDDLSAFILEWDRERISVELGLESQVTRPKGSDRALFIDSSRMVEIQAST